MPLSPAELERLRPVLERIVARLGPEEIWLFGSRAEDRSHTNSDYDFLDVPRAPRRGKTDDSGEAA